MSKVTDRPGCSPRIVTGGVGWSLPRRDPLLTNGAQVEQDVQLLRATP